MSVRHVLSELHSDARTGTKRKCYIYLNIYSSIPLKDKETDRQMDRWADRQTNA